MSIEQIINADTWKDLFPNDKDAARKKYRTLIRDVHPDVCPDPRASEAFIKVRTLYTAFQSGAVPTKDETPNNVTIVLTDDAFTLSKVGDRFFWIVNNPKDNDLMRHVPDIFTSLSTSEAPQFFPEMVSSLRDAKRRAGIEVKYPEGIWNLTSFEELSDRNVVWVFKRDATAD